MACSCWPWGIFRKPCDGTVAENLRPPGHRFRRLPGGEPFKDVIPCSSTAVYLRTRDRAASVTETPATLGCQVVRAHCPRHRHHLTTCLPAAASTLAAAEALGYLAIGTERDAGYFALVPGI